MKRWEVFPKLKVSSGGEGFNHDRNRSEQQKLYEKFGQPAEKRFAAIEWLIKPALLCVKFGAGGKRSGTFKRTKEVVLAMIIQPAGCGIRLELHATNRIGNVDI